MPRPICTTCQAEMVCSEMGFLVNDPAIAEFPSTYWFGDTFRCNGCAAEVVVQFGSPVGPHQCDPSESMEFYEPVVRSDADNGVDEIERLRNGLREIVSCSAVYGEVAGERASELLAG